MEMPLTDEAILSDARHIYECYKIFIENMKFIHKRDSICRVIQGD